MVACGSLSGLYFEDVIPTLAEVTPVCEIAIRPAGGENPRMDHQRGVALVTGASAGIGREFARQLAARGRPLVLVARDVARLEALAAELRDRHGVAIEVLPADLLSEEGLRAVEARLAAEPPVALLVNNAGIGTAGPFAESDIAAEVRVIELNVVALERLTRAALPGMIARRAGAIVNVSSLAGFQPGPYAATYYATKAYVTSFTEALHEELRGTGVRLQALCPGFTKTEFQMRAGIDRSRVPGPLWTTADQVVAGSLRALERGNVVYVPGWHFRLVGALSSTAPRALVRRVSGLVGRRTFG